MRLSVILSTFEAPDWLEKVLWGYRYQTHSDFEVVIADDGSGPPTKELIEREQDEGPLSIRHVWHPDDGFQKSRILNKAIAAANGEYLVFSDGDCIPRRDFLATHVAHARHGRFLSGGYVKLPMDVSRAIGHEDIATGRVFDARWLWASGARDFRRLFKLVPRGPAGSFADAITTTRPSWNGHNASGWRRDLEAVNGFDERMQYGGQDRELGERLENAEIRGFQLRHRAVCVHLDHTRGYDRPESIEKNRAIRRETREQSRTWTEYGLKPGPRETTRAAS